MERHNETNIDHPVSIPDSPRILLAHGGGGKMMLELIDGVFKRAFENPELVTNHDGAVINPGNGRLVFTTDSYVVNPLFFPGGDIGTLSINGTVNDLAMCGAKPLNLSVGFILEEGLPIEVLLRITQSMRQAALNAKVRIVTGDTKVVDKGKGDGIFINTSGIGILKHNLSIVPANVRPGDMVILNGDIGRHGIAIMLKRNEFSFETQIESDCAPLADTVMKLIDNGIEIHCMRDLTRGGLASALIEIAHSSGLHIAINESAIPVLQEVQGVCELLGYDPIYVANEGKFVAFIPEEDAKAALEIIRGEPSMSDACIIGGVTDRYPGLVTMKNEFGTERIIDLLSGEQLPRIC